MYAKEAVDALWKARGYHKMKPKHREEKLGYQLDREEALGYLVTSALHMPLLLPEEARMIGKRAGSLSVFTKLAEFQKRGTTASPPCVSLLAEAAPLSFSFAHSLKRSKDRGHPQRRHAVQRGATRNHFSGVGFPCLALLALADVVDRAPRQHAYDARHTLRRCGQIGIVFEVESPLLIFRRQYGCLIGQLSSSDRHVDPPQCVANG